MNYSQRLGLVLALLFAAQHMTAPETVVAQNSSLFQNPIPEFIPPTGNNLQLLPNRQPMATESGSALSTASPASPQFSAASWTYQPPSQARVLHVHDIVSIRVDEIARMSAEGRAAQRKNALYDGKFSEWIRMEGVDTVKPAVQSDGDPAIKGTLNTTYRANSDVITRETMTFNIAAEIADIRPNGNVVLEAHKTISSNDNRWQISLSGMCQSDDIGPDNVVMSRNLIDLKIDKRESGQARDGYRRGWLTEFFARFQPF